MEADWLERGLAGREVRFLLDSYFFTQSIVPVFVLKVHSPLALITAVDRRTRVGVDAQEGVGAEATGIGQRVGKLGNSLEKVTDARNRDFDLRYRE
ncbi:hypothetical protein VNO78_23658 [Psophocarpus tetragonolobus]|uniref:Uncharacterized protein n=1 Tax=Psophocarpus tetragonolobus TaxID=3891 RepID=A0AAN9XE77_PSOTE